MAAMSDWLERILASHMFGSGTFSKPTVIAVALTRDVPADIQTGATIPEVANAGSYARTTHTPSANNWIDPVGVGGACSNIGAITFPVATADWGWVSGVAICDSATWGAGNMMSNSKSKSSQNGIASCPAKIFVPTKSI